MEVEYPVIADAILKELLLYDDNVSIIKLTHKIEHEESRILETIKAMREKQPKWFPPRLYYPSNPIQMTDRITIEPRYKKDVSAFLLEGGYQGPILKAQREEEDKRIQRESQLANIRQVKFNTTILIWVTVSLALIALANLILTHWKLLTGKE